jgi:hypothetical protein
VYKQQALCKKEQKPEIRRPKKNQNEYMITKRQNVKIGEKTGHKKTECENKEQQT